MARAAAPGLAAILLAVAVGGCTTSTQRADAGLVSVAWRPIALPVAHRRPDRPARARFAAAGAWYAAGATVDAAGPPPGAVVQLRRQRLHRRCRSRPRSVYGPEDILSTVACDGSRVVAVGAESGGAHGNPRTSDLAGPGRRRCHVDRGSRRRSRQYGGPDAVGVGTVAAGAAGFLHRRRAGSTRATSVGAAVWQSPDGSGFTLVDNDPALESDARGATEVARRRTAAPAASSRSAGSRPARRPAAARDADRLAAPATGCTWQPDRASRASAGDDILLQQVIADADGSCVGGRRRRRRGSPSGAATPRRQRLARRSAPFGRSRRRSADP